MTITDAGFIEATELIGQVGLVLSSVLPADMGGHEEILRSWGIVLGDRLGTNELFRRAELPVGWTKRPTGHTYWTDLVDQNGRVRADIFYKAAFYDRRASLALRLRYRIVSVDSAAHVIDADGSLLYACGHVASDVSVLGVGPQPAGSQRPKKSWDEREADRAECRAWLDANRPGWKAPGAYWDVAV